MLMRASLTQASPSWRRAARIDHTVTVPDATFLPSATIVSLVWFAFVNSITPGPNNIMLATSGVNFGVRAAAPQMAGIFVGLLATTMAVGLGLGVLFSEYPAVREVLKLAGILYILWLAWRIATVALYVRPGHTMADTAVVAAAFALVNLPCMFVWAGFGALLREALKVPARIRAFNILMALALAASVLPLLRG
jgi:threonine/homoserine/homoserine lactone efflux protein